MTDIKESKKNWKDLTNSEKIAVLIVIFIITIIIFGIVNAVMKPSNAGMFSSDGKQLDESSSQESTQEEQTRKNYEELETFLSGENLAKKHYLYSGGTKPSYDEVKSFIVVETKKGCGEEETLCEYYLWDDKDAYEQAVYGNEDLLSGLADEIAAKNKLHLSGFVNGGNLVYYYGTTGDGSANSATIYDDTGGDFIIIK